MHKPKTCDYRVEVNPNFLPCGQAAWVGDIQPQQPTQTVLVSAPSAHGAKLLAERQTGHMAVQAQLVAHPAALLLNHDPSARLHAQHLAYTCSMNFGGVAA